MLSLSGHLTLDGVELKLPVPGLRGSDLGGERHPMKVPKHPKTLQNESSQSRQLKHPEAQADGDKQLTKQLTNLLENPKILLVEKNHGTPKKIP